jgi:hypothetical protein
MGKRQTMIESCEVHGRWGWARLWPSAWKRRRWMSARAFARRRRDAPFDQKRMASPERQDERRGGRQSKAHELAPGHGLGELPGQPLVSQTKPGPGYSISC